MISNDGVMVGVTVIVNVSVSSTSGVGVSETTSVAVTVSVAVSASPLVGVSTDNPDTVTVGVMVTSNAVTVGVDVAVNSFVIVNAGVDAKAVKVASTAACTVAWNAVAVASRLGVSTGVTLLLKAISVSVASTAV